MLRLLSSLTLLLAVMGLLVAAPSPIAACNSTYCSSRGTGTASSVGPDGCACACTYPYFGYRCRYQYTADSASGVVIDCLGDALLSADEDLCNSTKQCFWNTSESKCRSKHLPWYALNNDTTNLADLTVPACYRAISLPLQITVYACASAAFGVGGVGFFYMMRFRNTYSVLDDTGERLFNQFYSNPWPTFIYSGLLFAASGLLGITAYINFRDPTMCMFLYFFYAYIAVQALALLYPLKWMIQFCVKKYASPEKKMIQIDRFVRPTSQEIMEQEYGLGCKLRCF